MHAETMVTKCISMVTIHRHGNSKHITYSCVDCGLRGFHGLPPSLDADSGDWKFKTNS